MLSRIRIAVAGVAAAGLAAALAAAGAVVISGASDQPPPAGAAPRGEGPAVSLLPATTPAAAAATPDVGQPVEHPEDGSEHDTVHVASTVTDATLAAAATAQILAELEGPAGCCTAVTVTALVELPAAGGAATVLVAWTGTRHDGTRISEVTTTRWRSTPSGWQPVTPTPEVRHTAVIRFVGPACDAAVGPVCRAGTVAVGSSGPVGAAGAGLRAVGALLREPTSHWRAPKAPRTRQTRP